MQINYNTSVRHLLQLDNLEETRKKDNIRLDEIADELDISTDFLKIIEEGQANLITSVKYQQIIELLKRDKEQRLNKEELIVNINHNLKKLNLIGAKSSVKLYI